jgi:RNA-directed DNA polymerase
MKRIGNLWQEIITFENILLAAKKAARNKRFRPNVLEFNYNLENEIIILQKELTSQTYQPSEYTVFKIIDPKPRQISAAPFRDRVVHHTLCNIIIPIFERSFITDSYANRKGFGTHKALKRFTEFTRSSRYILQCDISKYFPTIDHEILKQIIRKKIKCPDTLWLIDTIIDRSNLQESFDHYFPNDDSLTLVPRRKGLPLGNLTSQFFANIYLNEFDRFVKEKLKIKKYLRYVDDFTLFANDKATLGSAHQEIQKYLADLRLLLHPHKTQIFATKLGANFVGFRILPSETRVLSKNIRRGRKRIRCLCKDVNEGKYNLTYLLNSFQAWRGHLQHADTWQLQQQLFGELDLAICDRVAREGIDRQRSAGWLVEQQRDQLSFCESQQEQCRQ